MAPALLLLAAAGLVAIGAGWAAIRASGAWPGLARRYAAAPEVRVGDLLDPGDAPLRPVRVVGRVRCADPLRTPEGETLVAYHRDVDVEVAGRWVAIDRLRETRSFELWDHDGALNVDPALAAEPLVAIPHAWQGTVEELDEHFSPAIERLATGGRRPRRARSVARALRTVDRLGVLAVVRREAGRVWLDPPGGGFVISSLDVPSAMRVLGGRRRRLLLAGYAGVAAGSLVLIVTAVAAAVIGLGT